MMWGYGFGYSWAGWLMMAFFWAFLLAGVVWLVRGVSSTHEQRYDGARRILDDRFARGEITSEEYEASRRVLQ